MRKINSKEMVFLSIGKHYGIIFRNGHSGVVLTDLADTGKTFRYSVQPYLDSTGVAEPLICKLNEDIDLSWLKKRSELVAFGNKDIFIVDQPLVKDVFAQRLKADFVYVTGNAAVLPGMMGNFNFNTIIFDGSNSDRLINSGIQNGNKKGFRIIVLKRNKSFISVSN